MNEQVKETKKKIALKPADFNDVVSRASLIDVRLIESRFSIKPEYFEEENAHKHKHAFDRSSGEVVFDDENDFFYLPISFAVNVRKGKKKLLTCECHYLVIFGLDGKANGDAVKDFAIRVGLHAAYPYFRQYVSSQSWSSGANLPTLPILRQGPKKP